MRNLRALDNYRISPLQGSGGAEGDEGTGAFSIQSIDGESELRVIASTAGGWDHVSVSLATRCPTWLEMEYIKRAFFAADETAMQLHVPPADHINNHPYCLHLWRPQNQAIPRPPPWMVGIQGLERLKAAIQQARGAAAAAAGESARHDG